MQIKIKTSQLFFTFDLFMGRSLKMNEKVTAALINILLFISTFRLTLQPFSRNYTAQVNKKTRGRYSLTRKLEPQRQTRDVTTREIKSRGRKRAMSRETSEANIPMDTNSENSPCLDGDECSFAFGSVRC